MSPVRQLLDENTRRELEELRRRVVAARVQLMRVASRYREEIREDEDE